MAERTRRTRRDRKPITVKQEVEEVEEIDEVEEEELEDVEDEVVEKPARRERRSRGKREVVKAEDDEDDTDDQIEELVKDYIPPTVAEATFGEFMDQMPTDTTFQISKDKNGVLTFTKLDGVTAAVAKKARGGGLRGKAWEEVVFSDEYKEYREEWAELTDADRVKRMKKDKISWEEHDDPALNSMRMAMAYQKFHNIEKYKPEYSTRAARDALKG